MSTAATDFENMLRTALDKATANAPAAEGDLIRLASEAAGAVFSVSGGSARLELALLEKKGDLRPTYQLQLWRVKSEAPASDLGVFRLAETGYPIEGWWWRGAWESNLEGPDRQLHNTHELKAHFEHLLSVPESKLVVLINHLRQLEAHK